MKKLLMITAIVLGTGYNTFAQNVENYILTYKDLAQKLMRDNYIPASVILGIAIYESDAGNNENAVKLNNHFGLRKPKASIKNDEVFRSFAKAGDSYIQFVKELKTKNSYKKLFRSLDQYNDKKWLLGIERGGYFYRPNWSSTVLSLIKQYNLTQYDDIPSDYVAPNIDPAMEVQKHPQHKKKVMKIR